MNAGLDFWPGTWIGFWGLLVATVLIFVRASFLGLVFVSAGGSQERSAFWMGLCFAGSRCMAMVQPCG